LKTITPEKQALRMKRVAAAKKAWVTIRANRAAKAALEAGAAVPLESDAEAREQRLRAPAVSMESIAGRAMAGLLAVFATFEREILRERTKAGLAHA
jgi:hypothetical protein